MPCDHLMNEFCAFKSMRLVQGGMPALPSRSSPQPLVPFHLMLTTFLFLFISLSVFLYRCICLLAYLSTHVTLLFPQKICSLQHCQSCQRPRTGRVVSNILDCPADLGFIFTPKSCDGLALGSCTICESMVFVGVYWPG